MYNTVRKRCDMEFKVHDGIVNIKETDKIEIKKAGNRIPMSLYETYSAFCNTGGGYIILGLEEISNDKYKVVGINDPDRYIDDLFNTLNNKNKVSYNALDSGNITIKDIDGSYIIIIEVPGVDYEYRPIYLDGNVQRSFKRSNRGDKLCSLDEVYAMIRDADKRPQDARIIKDIDYRDALDSDTVISYRQRFKNLNIDHTFNKLSDEKFLEKLGAVVIEKGVVYPTYAGLLMFGKTNVIRRYLPYYLLEYINYGDNGSERYIDRVIYDGTWGEANIFNFYYEVINRLNSLIPNAFKLSGDNQTRINNDRLKVAIREALVNTLVHADYKGEKRVQIRYEDKRLYFHNPGTLRISIEDFYGGKKSDPRNPNIMMMFRQIGLAEESGVGITTILDVMNESNLSVPKVIEEDNTTSLIIDFRDKTEVLMNDYKLKENELIVLKALDTSTLSRTAIEDKTGLSRAQVLQAINTLLSKHLISRQGQGKSTTYRTLP